MDRNGIDILEEKDAQTSEAATRSWLGKANGSYQRTFPILTPRFTPSCSDDLMEE